jgi:hypothetical protein
MQRVNHATPGRTAGRANQVRLSAAIRGQRPGLTPIRAVRTA